MGAGGVSCLDVSDLSSGGHASPTMDGKKNGGPAARAGNLTEIDDDVAQGDPENEEDEDLNDAAAQ